MRDAAASSFGLSFVLLLFRMIVVIVKTIIFELQRPESACQKISNDVLQHSLQPKIWKVQFSHFQKSYITCKHTADFYFTDEKCRHLVIFLMLVLLVIKAEGQALLVHCRHIYAERSGPAGLGQGLRNIFYPQLWGPGTRKQAWNHAQERGSGLQLEKHIQLGSDWIKEGCKHGTVFRVQHPRIWGTGRMRVRGWNIESDEQASKSWLHHSLTTLEQVLTNCCVVWNKLLNFSEPVSSFAKRRLKKKNLS